MKHWFKALCLSVTATATLSPIAAHSAVSIPFTVNLSEAVTVDTTGGTPRIAVDVGGTTRYAIYSSGSGSSALTFTLSPTIGDLDLDGVVVSSPIDLNGGTIADTAGNPATLTFTPPNTSGVNINYPSLGMDFAYDADGRYTLNGTAYDTLSAFLSATGGTFTRSSIGTYFDSSGTLQTASANTPRFDYDPVTLQPKGILIEASRQNVFNDSEAFNNWLQGSGVSNQTNTSTSPASTLTADTLTKAAGSNQGFSRKNVSVASNNWIISVYAKKSNYRYIGLRLANTLRNDGLPGSSVAVFDFDTQTFSNLGTHYTASGYESLPNGWYRIYVGTNTAATFAGFTITNAAGGENWDSTASGPLRVILWGAQLEQGTFPTSYIPTTTSAVTRAADSLIVPAAIATPGTWYSEVQTATSSTQASIFGVNPSAQQCLKLTKVGTNLSITRPTFGPILTMSLLPDTASSLVKGALSYSSSSASLTANGKSVLNVGSGSGGAGTSVAVGQVEGGSGEYINGVLKKLRYYPTRASDTQLQLMTQ